MGYEADCRVRSDIEILNVITSLIEERVEELKKTQLKLEKKDKKLIEIGIAVHRRCELEDMLKEIKEFYP